MFEDWLILLVPIAAYVITQSAKLAFDGIKGNMDIYHMWTMYGGMPSAHSAFVVSLSTYVGLLEGFLSVPFAIAVVFSIIAMRDAMGVRREIGRHGRTLNLLIQRLPEQEQSQFEVAHEKMGHSPLEVFVGSVFGLTIALLAFFFF